MARYFAFWEKNVFDRDEYTQVHKNIEKKYNVKIKDDGGTDYSENGCCELSYLELKDETIRKKVEQILRELAEELQQKLGFKTKFVLHEIKAHFDMFYEKEEK